MIMGAQHIDSNGHVVVDLPGVPVSVTPTAAAGDDATVTDVVGSDRGGAFTLLPVTGEDGKQKAGVVARVTFATPYGTPPAAVVVAASNDTDSTASLSVAAANVTTDGFDLVSTVLASGKAYRVAFVVVP